MKLYTKPGACSTADHIALQWTGCPFAVEVMTAETLQAPAYLAINPGGSVPAIDDDGFLLTQNAAILGYIADSNPEAKLAGDGSPQQRAEATRWLAFVNADLHPAFTPLFNPAAFLADHGQHAPLQATARIRLQKLFKHADTQLENRRWLAGFRSFADPYFYIALRWAGSFDVDLSGLANLSRFKQQMEADPDVRLVLRAEGLA